MKFKMIPIFLSLCEPQVEILKKYDIVSESRLPSRIFPEILNRKKDIKISK